MINLQPLILFYSYLWDDHKLSHIKFLYGRLKSMFTYKWNLPVQSIDKDLIFIQSMNRQDYNDFIQTVFNNLTIDSKVYIMIQKKKKFNYDFLKELTFTEYSYIWSNLKNIKGMKKLYIFSNIILLYSLKYYLKNYSCKILTVHADMQPIENFISQYFKSRGTITVTLQHGLYIDYSANPNINEVNYKNVVSDYFLAWGDETKLLIEHYNKATNVVICGNPTLKVVSNNTKQSNSFVVVFDKCHLREYNIKLLDIAKKLKEVTQINFYIKLHPSNQMSDYDILETQCTNDVENAFFVLGHVTSMLFTINRVGIPVFKLNSKECSNKILNIPVFNNINDLLLTINDIKLDNTQVIEDFYIKYIENEALNQYNLFYTSMIEERA
jgi:hypothetical protein